LKRISSFLRIAERADGYCPQPVAMPAEEFAKGIGVALNMTAQ
jgi:hypothetical protein